MLDQKPPYQTKFPQTAEEEAYAFLLHRIRMGIAKPGDRLIPEEIATEINTSRMPVREAFRRLASEGLVTIRPNRGVMVRGLDADEMEEVFGMRAALEGLAGRFALTNMQPRHIAHLRHLMDEMDRVAQDVSQWVTAHREFHEYLCHICGRQRLLTQIAALHSVVEPHMRTWLEHAEKPTSSREDHADILNAIEQGDPLRLERVIREHIEATVPPLRRRMEASKQA